MKFKNIFPYQLLCSFLIACLKPFTVVAECLLHVSVGERYASFSALVALLLLVIDAKVCPTGESTLVWFMIAAFVVRVIVLRTFGMVRRRRGDRSVHSRSPGVSALVVIASAFAATGDCVD